MTDRGERVPSPRVRTWGRVRANMLFVSTAWLRLNAFSKMLARVGSRPVGLTLSNYAFPEIVSTSSEPTRANNFGNE